MEKIKEVKCSLKSLPFKTSLSFELLIKELEELSKSNTSMPGSIAKEILKKLEKAPIIRSSNIDDKTLESNKELIEMMMAFVVNPIKETNLASSVSAPMKFEPFFTNNAYKSTLGIPSAKLELADKTMDKQALISMTYHAYMIILNKVYGINMEDDLPFILKFTNTDDNTVKYFNKQVNLKYLKINQKGNTKKLNQEELNDLFNHTSDLDYWNEKLALKNFEFSGIIFSQYNNVSRSYLISELKSDLLNTDSFINNESFFAIREKIRALIEKPNLEVGIALTRDIDSNKCEGNLLKGIISHERFAMEDYNESVFMELLNTRQIVVTRDLKKQQDNKIAQAYLERGIRSHALVPLILKGDLVGVMEMGSSEPEDLHMFQVLKLYDLYPVFALAAKRSNDEWSDKVRSVIQKKFTAIHPTIEWRFRDAVSDLISRDGADESSTINPIVFNDIVPIYGASDIRASSIERSKAVQVDLAEQLDMARVILANHSHRGEMPLLNDLRFKIEQNSQTVESGLNAGDEFSVVDFLKSEINPVFELLRDRFEDKNNLISDYFDKLDPELGILYKKRKDFEDSLMLINNKVSEIIDREQEKAQEIFPHYFEKYRTDGVEYNAYIGQSLVQNLKYSNIYLKNIRLWQLLVKVKIARAIEQLQPQLTTKLDITQLILVHSSPFSIEFRQDEKKFDVAGAYNIRYEITKKRIDKAFVKGSKERVTQVGKIAIIYSHADEIHEYRDFIKFMIAQGFLTNEVEELDLEDLKGASGLKAIRVQIDFSDLSPIDISPSEINTEVLEEII